MLEDIREYLPLILVELFMAIAWRLIVVEGRWFGRTMPDEEPDADADADEWIANPDAVVELQDDVAQLTQRVMELELAQETE